MYKITEKVFSQWWNCVEKTKKKKNGDSMWMLASQIKNKCIRKVE